MLGHVGQQLGHAVVSDRLDGLRRPAPQVDRHLGGHGAAGGQRGERALEADVEGGWMDPTRDVAQLGDGLLGAAVCLVHELTHAVEIDMIGVLQLLLGHAQPHRQGHQLGLGAVVQVALDPAQRGRRGVDRLGAGLLERTQAGGRRVGPEERRHEQAVDVDKATHGPRGGEEEHGAGDENGDPVDEADRSGGEVARGEEIPHEAEHGRIHSGGEEGVGQAGEGVPPQAEGHVEAEERPRHLEGEVGHGAPGDPVAQARLQPAEKAGPAGEGLGFFDLHLQEPPGQAALQAADAAGAPQREGEDGEPEEGDGEDQPRNQCEPDEGQADTGECAAHQIEGEVGPGTPGEGLMPDALCHRLDVGGLRLAHGKRHLPTHQAHAELAVLGLLGRHAPRRCNRTAPSQMTATV